MPAEARWHDRVVERAADTAVAAMPVPLRVLDVGCGSGALLRELVVRAPYSDAFVGLDPDPGALATAEEQSDRRIDFVRGRAEALPFADGAFDLVVSTTSFHRWSDPERGLAELHRVIAPRGKVVLVDLCAGPLRRTAEGARPARRIVQQLTDAGLTVHRSETLQRVAWTLPLVRAFVAGR
ncbi:MAG TPA: class I SAM-dependent methyltransferase [Jatrophihabitans sp.]|jgi:ubiquinone/menaquinone biosynthesis C-methylase UbiE|uniref:class I SAM-dependent methyltransferase n=1 Tax=Jatrophihabitans sp. TaxID=1932789 RepID=UPI002DF97B4A|nr:class I SAM-dependent methyltransferase [Jatrophihabitans sp.]